ncbi:DUF2058 domain-containing protein [Xanthomonas campestris]|uniref:DUF2058 domain-containing protein n=1 Tax=Xanthomonas campestris TaxID=339 RepID=UPI00096DF416|nr:DUF2058 domain-containing protein [Xanthomonas campestris]MCC5065182.1 DUF2058 domain-containing protein [Xanthomonas campestris pv. raphani]MCC8485927.1 DUF2058 domain-containing protein [Xanthomonas campestris]MCF8827714.1 DUF2058 domain-containing protein [Xanthomonas campestris pv. raphani]MEA9652112.1 DUF2058 domain-containing protein [Xanthomonas campestris pv. raphani]MEA9726344.1 DUF2058 domain-containing protein [Xanthomonas campestris pv. raphani]
MRNPLQEQLLKAGLVKKAQVDKVAREQNKQRHAKGAPAAAADPDKVDAARLQAERAERDRALAEERNAQLRQQELVAQVRQIIETSRVKREGEIDYRFNDGSVIRSVLVNPLLRSQLASGALVIVRYGENFELIPRAAAEKVYSRDATVVVLDHGRAAAPPSPDSDDDYYSQFKVPDDLIW